tara:strand:- start:317 stop:1075 length:759 start_codon:yes stop_codon:yes gene_type:complete
MRIEVELKSSDFVIQKNCGIDYKFITDWCIANENHPFFAHSEDGTATPNQFSDNLRAYVRAAKDGEDMSEMEHEHQFELDSEDVQNYKTYNPFTFGLRPFGDLYYALNKLFYSNPQVLEAREDYYIHGWFNVYTKNEYDHIPFHKHIEIMHPHIYHGFYCANVEPSTTTYRVGPDQPQSEWVVHEDYDDMLIYSASGFEHASSPWTKNKPRVTIAFDIFPESIYFGEQEGNIYNWSLDGRQYQAIPFPNLML